MCAVPPCRPASAVAVCPLDDPDVALTLPADLPRTAQPVCPYFGTCGGCALQDVEYARQVQVKQAALRDLLKRDLVLVPSPQPYGYRYKMEFVAAFGRLGFRLMGNYRQVVDLRECHLVQPRVSALLEDLHGWMRDYNIEGYDYMRHQGDLRYVVTRHAFSSDALLVNLVTGSTETRIEPLLEKLAKKVESVAWVVNSSITDAAYGQVQRILGQPEIRQQVGRFHFLLGPQTFFQNNLLLVEAMFQEIAAHVSGRVMDLFCGVGSIGVFCSDKASRIDGVETMPESIDLARRNAALNGVSQAFYTATDSSDYLTTYDGPVPDTVVVDPPRCGLAPRLIRKLLRMGPGRIVYVSCNPEAFAQDLPQFPNYALSSLKAFDMFPQTPHVELVAVLDRAGYPPLMNSD
jgi:tRNA (uracil-5-)-methyltransferase